MDAMSDNTAPVNGATADPVTGFASLVLENLARLQRWQFETALAWQVSWTAVAQEVFDEWACRFGGGVPLDG